MFKLTIILALIAVASSAVVPAIGTPLLARIEPQPKAPANTEHATHVAATVPIAQYIPFTYTIPSAPLLPTLPLSTYAGSFLSYSTPLEAHRYKIVY